MSCEGWKKVRLGDVIDIKMGQSPKGDCCNNEKNGIPLLNGPTEFGTYHPTAVQWTIDAKKICEEHDLLFCVRGSTTGRMNWADIKYCIGRGLASIHHKEGKDYRHFLKGVLDFHLPKILSSATGSTFPNVSKDLLCGIEIYIPPLQEQKAIASTLSALDDKIELNNKINKNLEEMAQAIFKSWFVDFEPFQDGEFVESELGLIPKGWRVGTLSEIASITSGKRPKNKHSNYNENFNIPIVGASSIMGYTSEVLYCEKILATGRVGTHGIVQRFNSQCWTSDNTLVLKSSFYEFTYQQLLNVDFVNMNRGSTQPLITQTDLKNVKIVIPYNDFLQSFEVLTSTLMTQLEENKQENQKLSQLRDTLLPKLMSGEIRVPLESSN